MTSIIQLDARLDLRAATALAGTIRDHDGSPLGIDAGQVQHLGALCLQILLATAASWRARGLPLSVTPRSQAFDTTLGQFGIAPAQVQSGVAG
jgi:chemotaxis protein CheX